MRIMTTAAELVLVLGLLGLLLNAQCEVRPRDPEEEEQGGRGGGVGMFETVVTPPTGDRYKQLYPLKQKISAHTHTGSNVHLDSRGSEPITGMLQDQYVQDQQNDHKTTHPIPDTGHAHAHAHAHHGPDMLNPHRGRQHQPRLYPYDDGVVAAHPETMALMWSQLHPLLHSFNCSLDQLTRQVGELTQEVLQLKSKCQEAELQEDIIEGKLEQVYESRREVQAHMDSRLHSLLATLHYNLSSWKTDVDVKLKTLQTLAELKVNQDRTTGHAPPSMLHPQPLSWWEAIKRLDNRVVNNTVKLGGLMEDVDVTSGEVQGLRFDLKDLEKLINQSARRSQILFMETGLEVEHAKVEVLKKVEQLSQNMTQQNKHLQEVDVDMDYLFTALYHNHSGPECDCKALTATLLQLERGVANVTALANENRIALEADDDVGVEQWGGASDWEPAVEAVQRGLQLVKETVDSEPTRTLTLIQTLNQTLDELGSSVGVALAEVRLLKQSDEQLKKELQLLSSFFNSLLKDAIRHSEVLELLLGEDVLEFLEWPVQDQEANSIPALKEQLRNLQKELRGHSSSRGAGGREEVPSADKHSFSSSGAQEQQLLLQRPSESDGDESETKVRQLEDKPCPCLCPSSSTEREVLSKLQEEVTWLKRDLEEHLRVFKKVFTNADVLEAADAALDLEQVRQLVKTERKRGGGVRGGAGGRGEEPGRNRRDLPGGALVSEDSIMFLVSLTIWNGIMTFDPMSMDRGHFHLHTGTFSAPVNGVYFFILTLNLKSGFAHVVLRKGGGVSLSLNRQHVTAARGRATFVGLLLLRKGEELWLELRGRAWADSEDNVFTGLLLHRTT